MTKRTPPTLKGYVHRSPRKRLHYIVLTSVTMLAGLASRSAWASSLPDFVHAYAGDTLWAMMVYFAAATIWPRLVPTHTALCAARFAVGIEVSQLFRPEWLEFIRDLPGMRLVFGYGFLWSDLACYTVGILLGWTIDCVVRHFPLAN